MHKCKICKSETNIILDKQFKQKYYSCPACEFIFLEESKILSPEEERKDYLTHNNTLKNSGYVKMFKDFIEKAIIPFVKPGSSVLDFGSGTGPVLAHLLKELKYKVDIYDPYFSPEKVHENKNYDLITSTEVIEHLKDPIKTLRELKDLLKPKGILSIMTLFHPRDEGKFLNWQYKREKTHIGFYTPMTMQHIAYILELKILNLNEKNICVFRKV